MDGWTDNKSCMVSVCVCVQVLLSCTYYICGKFYEWGWVYRKGGTSFIDGSLEAGGENGEQAKYRERERGRDRLWWIGRVGWLSRGVDEGRIRSWWLSSAHGNASFGFAWIENKISDWWISSVREREGESERWREKEERRKEREREKGEGIWKYEDLIQSKSREKGW